MNSIRFNVEGDGRRSAVFSRKDGSFVQTGFSPLIDNFVWFNSISLSLFCMILLYSFLYPYLYGTFISLFKKICA